ncbi:hypothetical protein Dda_1902 [Drechslerella dactyloides]|uniref:Uncharacterized protein n=1 Tax=Drechslerella dactyloides TaxID=74499 RepID=A0AAD6J2I3_DREDA|nr:hypothetical protein Dda_1902 [Drechslerella dactyloides]
MHTTQMPPRKKVKIDSEGEQMSQQLSQAAALPEHSHKKRRFDLEGGAPASRRRAESIKMGADNQHQPQQQPQQTLRRSARLQQISTEHKPELSISTDITNTATATNSTQTNTTLKKTQRARAKTLSHLPKVKEGKPLVKRRQEATDQASASSPKRRRRKSTSARRDETPLITQFESTQTYDDQLEDDAQTQVRDSDGVLWTKMPFTSPQEIYNFSAEFYIAPPKTVEVNAHVGPPPIIVRLHIVDKKTGQEVPYDNDPEWYYWTVARVLHEDSTLCTEPEFLNHSQTSESPMSWFHEEQEEDTRTPVTQTPPPGGPVKKWKTFVTFPNIQIPAVGKYRIKITLGVYIDQRLQAPDGREKTEKLCKELVATTSDVILVQEEEPKDDEDDQTEELLRKKDLYDKLLAGRDEFFKRQTEQDESF